MEPVPDSQQSAEAPESEVPPKNEAETEAELLLSRVQKVIDKIMANHSNPRPNLFHALASIMETQESSSWKSSVAIRLRPQNAKELVSDADFADCVELQPEDSNGL